MKKIILTITFLIASFFLANVCLAEQVNNFDVTIQINQDASVDVAEKIDYDFGNLERHGIYRDIIIKYPNARLEGNYNLRISNIKVFDEQGNEYETKITYPENYVNIRIGDANVYVTGQKTYLIKYKIKRAFNYFADYDEFYWNITGSEWNVPILKSQATVYFPKPTLNAKINCFWGFLGSDSICQTKQFIYNDQQQIIGAYFEQTDLGAYEGLSAVIGLEKGTVTKVSAWQNLLYIIEDNWILGLPVIVLIVLIYLWYTRGRDPQGRGTIIAQFEQPDNLTPGQVGAIADEKVHHKDISAEIINLAIKGYLKINRIEKKGIFGSADYNFEKLKEADGSLNNYQKELLDSIFGKSQTKKLSSLKDSFYKDLAKIEEQLYDSVVAKKYFTKNPKKIRAAYISIGFVILFLTFTIGPIFGGSGYVALIASALMLILFSFIMPQKTKEGVLAKEHILGLKEYLTVAEKDRLKFHNAPAKNPQEFEKLLPFAMVLGVEKEWAGQFKNIYKDQQPSWYNDPSNTNFNSLLLANSLNNFQSQSNTTLSSRPSSAAGGGSSGFSGGGFSGGGFGGGGGGSW